jgi:glycosyltransferase involved in cell wall biosynthesis
LRITFVVPGRGLHGGIKVMGEYAGRLRARGHDVTVLYRRTAKDLGRWLRRVLSRRVPDALDESGCPLVGALDLVPEFAPDADVLVTTGLEATRAAAAFPAGKGRLVEIVQDVVPMEAAPDLAKAVMARPALRVAVSDHVREYLKTRFGLEAIVVPNGVDHSQFSNTNRQFRSPRSVGMMYVPGHMKGTAEGFEAMARVRGRWPEVRLVLFGASRPRPRPPRTETYVHPKAKRLRGIYSGCEVWLAPSRSEGFGLTVLEAMACRVVPVAARSGGHEFIIEDGVSGFLVPVGDAEAMAGRIALLVEDESLLRKMSEAAHERSLAFDWERSTDRLESLLREWAAPA